MISNRAIGALAEPSPLVVAHFEAAKDPYHPTENPRGAINLGTAENYLMEKELLSWLSKVPPLPTHAMHYDEFRGSAQLREVVAEFLCDISGITHAKAEHIVIGSGVSSLLESLAFVLFNEGDSLIIPSPYYTGYAEDFSHRFGVKIIAAPMQEKNDFDLDMGIIEQTYDQAISQGEKVKAILINNPNNPLGRVYTLSQLESLIDFAIKRELQIIADEIYAHSIYDESNGGYRSVLSLGEDYQDSIHVLYGLAKDFGLSGFKFALCYSKNEAVLKALAANAYFYNVSTLDQHVVAALLSEREAVKEFLAIYKTRLLASYNGFLEVNQKTIRVPVLPSQGGHFVFIKLAEYLSQQNFESERMLYEKIWNQVKVNITPGQYFCCAEPGWFRLCFANESFRVNEALKRIHRML